MPCAERPNTLCILVVSEDRTLTRELSQFLNTAGYRTLVAAEPQMAERAVETGQPQIALIDSRLGSRNHWTVCRHLGEGETGGRLLKLLIVEKPARLSYQSATYSAPSGPTSESIGRNQMSSVFSSVPE